MRMPPILISGTRLLEKGWPRLSRALRAYLKVAGLAAQMIMLVAIFIVRIPDETSSPDHVRGSVVLLLGCVVAAVREVAKMAFDAALNLNEAMFAKDGDETVVSISAACPLRALVVLRIQLVGLRWDTFCR